MTFLPASPRTNDLSSRVKSAASGVVGRAVAGPQSAEEGAAHAGAANLEETAHRDTMLFQFLVQRLMDPE